MMRVTMLGISGSGKTSYMAGLAQRMCNIGVSGYTISPVADNAATSALKRSTFTQLMFSHSDFEFPPGTITTTPWVFALAKEGRSNMLFEWVDFRGGFIDQLYTGVDNASKSDIEGFLRYSEASDAILVFIDSIRLYKYKDNTNALEHFTKLPALFQYIVSISASDPTKQKRTLVIVNTKSDSDLLPKDLQSNNFSALNELSTKILERYIAPLFKDGWHVAVCSTGSVGIGCVRSTETPGKSFRDVGIISTEIIDHPNPSNVETPLLYCLLHEIRRVSNLASNKVAQLEYQKNKLAKENNLAHYIFSKLQKTATPSEKINNINNLLQEEYLLLNSFKPSIPELEALVRGKIRILSV